MRKYNKYNKNIIEATPILNPLITYDFFENVGVKIKINNVFKPLDKYLFSIDFYSQKEFEEFIDGNKTITYTTNT